MTFIKKSVEKFFKMLGQGFWENYWILNFFANLITFAVFLGIYLVIGSEIADLMGLFLGSILFLTLFSFFLFGAKCFLTAVFLVCNSQESPDLWGF